MFYVPYIKKCIAIVRFVTKKAALFGFGPSRATPPPAPPNRNPF